MIALALALMLIGGQKTQADTVTTDLEAIERQLATSWKKGDCAAWNAMVADDWSVIHITGAIMTKAEVLQICQASATSIETFDIDELVVRAFNDTAVVTGRTTVTTAGAQSDTVRLRFTDVFIRRGASWQVVASHATRLAQ